MSRAKNRKWQAEVAKRIRAMQERQGTQSASRKAEREVKEREHWENVCAQIYAEFKTDLVGKDRTVSDIISKYDELKRTLRKRVRHRSTLNIAIKKIHDACQELKVFAMIPKQKKVEDN